MAKQSIIADEYILQIEDNGHVNVVRIPKNAKATMIKIAEDKGFQYDPKWNTHSLGSALCKEFGDKWTATFDDITITRQKDNKIEIVQECKPIKSALKDICDKMGFEYDPTWNTQYFGYRVAKYLLENKEDADQVLQTNNMKKCAESVASTEARNTEELVKFEENGKYGFKDENGKVVIPCQYDYASWRWENGYCNVEIDRKMGYIDSTGKVIIPIEYESASYMEVGNYFIVNHGDMTNKKIGVMSPEGKLILPYEYDNCDTRWLKDKWVLQKDGVSYILGNGGVIENKLPYEYYEEFDNTTGLSLVRRAGKWGYVNKALEEVVVCENQYYVLCVSCNPYLLESMPMDADTLKENFFWLNEEFEDDFKEKGLNRARKLSPDNVGEIFSIAERSLFQQYRNEYHSYIDEVEQISLAPVNGNDWWNEWQCNDHDDDVEVCPDEVNIEFLDVPVNENCIETIYKRATFACGYFYELIIKDIEDFDPSKLKVANSSEDSYVDIPNVFYDEKPLKNLGNGFGDCEFEYSTARLFWDGEEIDLPEKGYYNEDW